MKSSTRILGLMLCACPTLAACAFFSAPDWDPSLAGRIELRTKSEPANRQEAFPVPREGSPVTEPRARMASVEADPSRRPSAPQAVRAAPRRDLSLEELLTYADRLSPRLRAARARAERAEAGEQLAFAAFLPELGVTYRWVGGTEEFVLPTFPTYVGNFAYGGESDRFQLAELAVQWLVWDFGMRLGQYRRAGLALEIMDLEFQRARETLAFDVTAGYFELLRSGSFVEIAERAVARAQSVLNDAENFQSAGTAIVEDVERAEVQLAQMNLELVRAQTRRKIAAASLNRTVGFHVSSPIAVLDRVDPPGARGTLAEALALAVSQRDEFRMVEAAIESSNQGLGISQADFLPRVLVGGSGINIDNKNPEIGRNMFAGGVTIELGLFEGGRRLGALNAANAELREAIARAQEMCDTIAFEVVSAHVLMADARESIRLGDVSLRHARENMRVEHDLFRRGDATATDIAEAELVLVRSEQQYFDALYAYGTARARLRYAMGGGE